MGIEHDDKALSSFIENYQLNGYVVLSGLLAGSLLDQLNQLTEDLLTRAGAISAEDAIYDLEPGHTAQQPAVRRIKKPHDIDALYRSAAADKVLLPYLKAVIGHDIRLHHSKINTKQPLTGSSLEWHQDWAFIPHTNQSVVVASLMLDDVDATNGPMLVIPGSHRKTLLDHRNSAGEFTGAIDPDDPELSTEEAVAVTGPAGTVTLHHPLLIHGAGPNRSERRRNVLFYEYAAADAWPLFYGVNWPEYSSRLICGKECIEPRLEPCFVRMGYPRPYEGSIYANQQAARKRFFTDR
ncbi:phytanoyl-CoA dioxygenase family protein [Allohahella marinimesophila]|uniref:Ectoine hydroxylase-related dioxygenase (Phytanoyl-CoA dioxygenase family) n=1 Tax=Allohahella marinimesophila TaxID=1054972 RepID=A0ABP7NIF8_9GAMM